MDPFSGVTALVPIALMLLKASCELKAFIRALRTAPQDVDHFMDGFFSYSKSLENIIHMTKSQAGYNLDSAEEAKRRELVDHVIKQATFVMKGVKENVYPIFNSVHDEENPASTGFVTRLQWYMKKSEVTNLRKSLEDAKSNAQLLLSMFNYDLNLKNGLVLQTFLKPNQVPRQL